MNQRKLYVSVVMPCFNEEKGVEKSIDAAIVGIGKAGGEIIVVDNGSTDRSVEMVEKRRGRSKAVEVKLVREKKRGYGAALLRGFKEAAGQVVVMGDSDGTYDFGELQKLTRPIFEGSYDLVVGSRMKGKQEKGAMPFLHRVLGTPVLTKLINNLFDLKLSDSQSGYRAISAQSFRRLGMRMSGMEFASEMLVRAARAKLSIVEVPVSYRRRVGDSKLVPLADAWRHLRFLLLFSPGRLFTVPGVGLFLLGLVFFILTSLGPVFIGRGVLDIHTLSISGMVALLGFQLLSLGMYSRVYGKYSFGIDENDFVDFFIEKFQLEQGIRVGGVISFVGMGILVWVGAWWAVSGFSALSAVRPVVVGTILTMLGAQMIFGSFFLSFLRGEGR